MSLAPAPARSGRRPRHEPRPGPGQERAAGEIIAARQPGERHLLTGYAGSGKTTLMQHLARE